MNEADIEIEERKPRSSLDLENTEYDWGHNIRNYMEE